MPKRPAPADGPEETDGILEQEWVVKEEEEEEEEEEEARPGARFLTPTVPYITLHCITDIVVVVVSCRFKITRHQNY